jgi:protein-S-isoprenylcysteine O-methyltransferase Ste14
MIFIILTAAVLVLSSGDPAWAGGWLYLVAVAGGHLVTAWVLALADPRLVRERSDATTLTDTKVWDRRLAPLAAFGPLVVALVAGLGVRMRWNPVFHPAAMAAGILCYAVGFALTLWAMTTNPFYTSVVRIRPADGHTVAPGGPYRFVRHPGALGTIVAGLATPLVLGSPWALAPAIGLAGVLVLRAVLEDRALRAELPGYQGYAGRVRWGLVPGAW